eukprot:2669853-Rhodomonas_salina.1
MPPLPAHLLSPSLPLSCSLPSSLSLRPSPRPTSPSCSLSPHIPSALASVLLPKPHYRTCTFLPSARLCHAWTLSTPLVMPSTPHVMPSETATVCQQPSNRLQRDTEQRRLCQRGAGLDIKRNQRLQSSLPCSLAPF